MPESARAFWTIARECGEIRTVELSSRAAGHVRVRTTMSGISRGTERLVFLGLVPDSEHARMRAPFQDGAFPFPVKYGYCAVGTAIDSGRRVFCLHPHQDLFDVPDDAATPIPDAVPDARATLAANMETAINAVWDSRASLGDRIAVIGAGVVGLLVSLLLRRIPGISLQVIDTDESRRALARSIGLGAIAVEAARGECDLVIHASGTPAGLTTALGLAGMEARVIELSWYGRLPVALPLGHEFHAKRLQIISSQVGTLPAAQRSRWTHRRRLALALDLLADSVYDALIGEPVPFDDLPQAMARILAQTSGKPHTVIRYD